MDRLIIGKIQRILKNKKKLEQKLGVRIENRGKEVFITGQAEDEYVAEKVIESLEMGFPFSTAMLIREEDHMFEIINIKDHTTRKDLNRIRARIIGKKGKTLKVLSDLTECHFEMKDNTVGIIGKPEYIKNAQEAIISIVRGSKQSNVYKFLEKKHPQEVIDLGLKNKK
ncbi:MAG: KH domain-containing protein [Nanoarchaeota archaeon]|nr:KH domain-containing protein [Nanoarchaeota archaeon]